MPAISDLDELMRIRAAQKSSFDKNFPEASSISSTIPLIHVCGRARSFQEIVTTAPFELPTSKDTQYYSDDTRRAETLLDLPCSNYYYAGRAHPSFGNIALAFSPSCEDGRSGSATPFDTGGLLHPAKYIRIRLTPDDDEVARVAFGKASIIELDLWRSYFARFLAGYFDPLADYWESRPAFMDKEQIFEMNDDWRSWTFEIRFTDGVHVCSVSSWCAMPDMMNLLRRMQVEQLPSLPGDSPSVLDQFLSVPPLEPAGSVIFCKEMEVWSKLQTSV